MLESLANFLGISVDELQDIIPLLSFVLSVVVALLTLIKSVRRAIKRIFFFLFNRIAFTRMKNKSKYDRKFLERHSELRNIYLDKIEKLNLQTTYIPLHVRVKDKTERKSALAVLADQEVRRILILGDPGTGKTTLLKAFGTGILQGFTSYRDKETRLTKNIKETPFFIDLRHFAKQEYTKMSLFEYLVEYILKTNMKIDQGELFLKNLLSKDKCLIMLDGLDEISEKDYPNCLLKITNFCTGADANIPTNKARIVITCRKQNFIRLRNDWVPKLFSSEYTLAPFTDNDILSFLNRRKADFARNSNPEKFFEQIQNSGMIDLHRNPLILTISLGLFINIPKYQIPRSIGKFYEEMIGHLIQRHDFRARLDIEKKNRFDSEDKIRFLREFALAMAERGDKFEEFSYKEIRSFLSSMCGRMANVNESEVDGFLREIIDHSGLLIRISDEDDYIFAHRSIHEYFAAVQLARNPKEGSDKLIAIADNPLWRQIIIFFAALDHDLTEPFLERLKRKNLELAGHCLPAMQVLPESIARSVINLLKNQVSKERLTITLSALVTISNCAKAHIQDIALNAIQSIVTDFFGADDVSILRDLKRTEIVKLLTQISSVGSRSLAKICVGITSNLEVGIDIIASLWRGLYSLNLSEDKAIIAKVIFRLLDLSMSEEGVVELQKQPKITPDFVTIELRREVYPFNEAHDLDSNLVTLLAWAEKFVMIPKESNKFFKAKVENKDAWMKIEQDSKRKAISLRLFPIGIVFVWGPLLLAIITLPILIFTHGWQNFVKMYFSSHYYLLLFSLLGPLTTILVGIIMEPLEDTDFALQSHTIEPPGSNIMVWKLDEVFYGLYSGGDYEWDDIDLWKTCLTLSFPLLILSCFWHVALLASASLPAQIVCNILLNLLFFWLPATRLFKKDRKVFIRKPNPFIGIYDDPRSAAWIQLKK